MTAAANTCILALDLGTSAFKAAPVTPSGLLAEPAVVAYEVDTSGGRITCPPERYSPLRCARLAWLRMLPRRLAAAWRRSASLRQAQTFLPVDRAGRPLADAVVWLDNRAEVEARRLSEAIPNVAAVCGFRSFTGQQFLPKVMHMLHEGVADTGIGQPLPTAERWRRAIHRAGGSS